VSISHASSKDRLTPGLAFAVFGVWIVWGAMYLVAHKVLTESPPLWMAAVRFTIAGGGLFAALAATRSPLPTRRQWRNAVLTGIVMMGLASGSTISAQQWNSSGIASVIASTATLWFALLGVVAGLRPSRLEWASVALGIIGVVVLFSDQSLVTNVAGLLIGSFGALAWAAGSVWSQRLDLPGGWMRSATQMLSGGIFLLIVSTLSGERPLFTPSPQVALAWAATIVGGLIGFGSYSWLLARGRANLAISYAYMNPLVALGLGVAFEGERLGAIELLGIGVILAAVVATTLAARAKKA
jgi:drug/metabolite transporter (DMT)-like permease